MDFKNWLLLEMPMKRPENLVKGRFVSFRDESFRNQVQFKIYEKSQKYIISSMMMMFVNNYWTPHQNNNPEFIHQGYGPLLYDLAIEYATMKKSGVVPAVGNDAGWNTDQSNAVWKKYYTIRPDIEKESVLKSQEDLDNVISQCLHYDLEYNPKDHPWLWTIYRKPPVFWNELKSMGKLREES